MSDISFHDFPNGTIYEKIWVDLQETKALMQEFFREQKELHKEIALEQKELRKETDRRMQETDRRMQETDRRMQETDRQMQEYFREQKELHKEIALERKGIALEQKETDRQMQETDQKMQETDRLMTKTLEGIAELRAVTLGIGESNGSFSEDYFFNSLGDPLLFGGIEYERAEKGRRGRRKMPDGKKLQGEFDITMYNGDSVALIEVKYKARKDDVFKLINEKVANFKVLFKEYANYKFYLGIAGMSFEPEAEEEAKKLGVGILRPMGENIEILDENLWVY